MPRRNPPSNLFQRQQQRGVVLIVALIMLVVISLLAVMGLRNSASSEAISGAVRSGNLALQAAEVALRFCENDVRDSTVAVPGTVTVQTTGGVQWQDLTKWDGSGSVATVFVTLPALVNQTDLATTYQRFPECMVEIIPTSVGGVVSTSTAFVITARGFGPEVAAVDSARTRPQGSEAWLQSTIALDSSAAGGGAGGGGGGGGAGGDEDKTEP